MKADIVTFDNKKQGSVELADTVFGLPERADILARVVNWQLAKRRAGTHSTKSTGEVMGSTAKIYRQKGTGRARHGSRKTNIFRGGAVGHGPVPHSHAYKLPKKVRVLGLKTALSVKQAEGKLIVVESGKLASPKTKDFVKQLGDMGVSSALIIDGSDLDDNLCMAAANIPGIDVVPSMGANVYDIMRRDTLVLTKDAVEALQARLS